MPLVGKRRDEVHSMALVSHRTATEDVVVRVRAAEEMHPRGEFAAVLLKFHRIALLGRRAEQATVSIAHSFSSFVRLLLLSTDWHVVRSSHSVIYAPPRVLMSNVCPIAARIAQ